MQGVHVSWVGQTTSLLRCSASKENKSRTRLTKEEKRTLALSFIKKYQGSNNGKFPSLNLTHKEVGGSFYSVREILREIIQENKVLGPGNPSSKLLNLEYCSENEVDKGSLVDVHSSMSISTIVHGMDHYEVDSLVKEGKGSSEEYTAIIKPFFKEESSNGMVLHEKLVNTLKKSDVHTLTLKKDGIPGGAEQVNDEVQLNSSEDIDIQYVTQSVLLDHSAPGTSLVESEVKNEDSKNKISGETQLFKGSTNISDTAVTESSPGTIISFSDTVNDQVNCCLKHDNGGALLLVSETFAQDSSSETTVLAASSSSQISGSFGKVHFPFYPFENGTVINDKPSDTEGLTTNSFTTTKVPSFANIGANKGPIKNGTQVKEISSSSESDINLAEAQTADSFFSQTLRSIEPGTIENDIHWVDKCNSFADAIKESKICSSKLREPNIQETNHSEVQAKKQSDAFCTANVGGHVRSLNEMATKESEKVEMNPMLAAIQAFISYFIRFWSE